LGVVVGVVTVLAICVPPGLFAGVSRRAGSVASDVEYSDRGGGVKRKRKLNLTSKK